MREIYSDLEHAKVGYFQSILQDAGIDCFIRNQYDNANLSGISFCPTLCITRDEDYAEAIALLQHTLQPLPPEAAAGDWECLKCREQVPSGFEICWSCQSERPEPT